MYRDTQPNLLPMLALIDIIIMIPIIAMTLFYFSILSLFRFTKKVTYSQNNQKGNPPSLIINHIVIKMTVHLYTDR